MFFEVGLVTRLHPERAAMVLAEVDPFLERLRRERITGEEVVACSTARMAEVLSIMGAYFPKDGAILCDFVLRCAARALGSRTLEPSLRWLVLAVQVRALRQALRLDEARALIDQNADPAAWGHWMFGQEAGLALSRSDHPRALALMRAGLGLCGDDAAARGQLEYWIREVEAGRH
jgi:hypothetical protein